MRISASQVLEDSQEQPLGHDLTPSITPYGRRVSNGTPMIAQLRWGSRGVVKARRVVEAVCGEVGSELLSS